MTQRQLDQIIQMAETKMKIGQHWEQHVIGVVDVESDWSSAGPGTPKMPTRELAGSRGLLAPHLCMDEHYTVVPEAAWQLLVHLFGCDGPHFRRTVVARASNAFLEVYLLDVLLAVVDDYGHLVESSRALLTGVSASLPVSSFFHSQCRALRLNPSATRIFILTPQTNAPDDCELIDDFSKNTMSDLQVGAKQILCFQEQFRYKRNKWPPLPNETGFLGFFRRLTKKSPPVNAQGCNQSVMGLGNLGNTCFLASTLQLLLHCPPLLRFFLENEWKKLINRDNKMGTRGALTHAFATLISKARQFKTWIYPKEIKSVISKFAPQFSGYRQHDSQEVLAFILDAMHEDFNSITQKPYRESNEVEGSGEMTDSELAGVFWERHKERNDSPIVNMFHGQLKSRLQCPEEECGNVSVTFDPFAYLQLSLRKAYHASVKRQFLEITLMNGTSSRATLPRKYSVSWPENSANCVINSILARLSDLSGVPPSSICLGRLLDHGVAQIYSPQDPVENIKPDHHAFAWVRPASKGDLRMIHVVHAILPRYSKATRRVPFGLPITVFARAQGTLNGAQVYSDVWKSAACYIRTCAWRCLKEGAQPIASLSRAQKQQVLKKMAQDVGESGFPEGFRQDCDCCWAPMCLTSLPDANYYTLPHVSVGKYPFALTIMQRHQCFLCDDEACDGCILSDSSDAVKIFTKNDDDPIEFHALWTRQGYNSYYDEKCGLNVRLDPSVTLNREIVQGQKREAQVLTLDDCLAGFSATEMLDKNNMWYCNVCKEHKMAWKQMQIYSVPEVLIIHFKRFSHRGRYRTKLTTGVRFPLSQLDLSSYVLSEPPDDGGWIYDLYAVSNHSGDLGGGHYTAYGATGDEFQNLRWHFFNDDRVSDAKEDSVCSSAAYVCLYVRRAKVN